MCGHRRKRIRKTIQMEKEKQITRIRQPIHLTLSKNTIELLKNTGNNASKVIDSLVKDAFSESKQLRVLI
jgi:hypothetical protein